MSKKEIVVQKLVDTSNLTPLEIALGIDEEGATTARKLYEFLELDPSHYNRWVQRNIIKNEFAEEGKEYQVFARDGENLSGGRPTADYKLYPDFAKKLAMGTHNEKGEIVKKYYIALEDKMKKIAQQTRLWIGKIAAEKRTNFTGILQDHGCNKQHHFIQITRQMKESLGIDVKKKKPDCDSLEVMKIAVSEDLAGLGVIANDSQGYYECRDISRDAAMCVKEIASKGNLKLTFTQN